MALKKYGKYAGDHMQFGNFEITSGFIDNLLSSLSDGICILNANDPEHSIVYVNPAYEAMTGYSKQEAIGQPFLFLNVPQSQNTQLDLIQSSLSLGKYCFAVLRNQRKSGELFWNETTLSSIKDHNDKVMYFICVQKDISDTVQQQRIIQQQIDSLQAAKFALEGLSRTDALTGLYNKRYFEQQYPVQFSIAQRNQDNMSVFMVDVDHFKQYNDYYGHLAGDECLKHFSNALSNVFKRSSDFVARFGGEEFIIYSVGLDQTQAIQSANNLIEHMHDLKIPHAKNPFGHITASVGIASSDWQHSANASLLIEHADQAMYKAKQGGRNQVLSF